MDQLSPAWVSIGLTLALSTVAAAVTMITSDARYKSRVENLERRATEHDEQIEGLARDIRAAVVEIRGLVDSKHERLRHDYANIQTQLIGLIEEKGKNEERHSQNVRTLERILRRMDGDQGRTE